MYRTFEFGQRPDIGGRPAEVGVAFETARRDDIPQQIDDALALAGHLRLCDRVEQQEAPVVLVRGAEVISRPGGEDLHRHQSCIGVGEHPSHMREIGDPVAVENAVVGVRDGLEEGVLADADTGPAEVDLAHVDRRQGGVEGGLSHVQDVGLRHRIGVQVERGDEHLPGDDVPNQFIGPVAGVDKEEHMLARMLRIIVGELAVHAESTGGVAVSDVPLSATGTEPVGGPAQDHVRGIDVRTVFAFGQPETENVALVQQAGDECARDVVCAEPHRAQTEHRDLPGIPVRQ